MCGIAGFWDRGLDQAFAEVLLKGMASSLRHRGPDSEGVQYSESSGIGFAHRRLAVVDLSSSGHQPMESEGGRYRLIANGELYNFRELRARLEGLGHGFRGSSDTEVMLGAFVEWGLDGALERFNGMFAFALWDAKLKRLHLVRDRVGEKPLYYGFAGGRWAFSSELRSMRSLHGFNNSIDRRALALLVQRGYVPAPLSIFEGIRKLPAGTVLTVSHDHVIDHGQHLAPRSYWQPREVVERGLRSPVEGSTEEIVQELDGKLREAVGCRLTADVPIGAFLSGGVDSSLVVAMMQDMSESPVKTFTVGFDSPRFDEAAHASRVAEHLGTDHSTVTVTSREALDLVPKLPEIFDEPFADPSQIPTHLVSRLARSDVKVVLSGDGGDELFGGYGRYSEVESLWTALSRVPRWLRRGLGRALDVRLPLPAPGRPMPLGPLLGKIGRLSRLLPAEDIEDLYRELLFQCPSPGNTVLGVEANYPLDGQRDLSWLPEAQQKFMFFDFVSYLPECVLMKLDRASMRVNLEGRLPLLDSALVEYVWRLPLRYRVSRGQSKWLLREVLSRYVPRHLFERPKQGFEVPMGEWLRTPLRPWVEDLLAEERLEREGFFQAHVIRRRWQEHLSGARDWRFFLWSVLMFQQWCSNE